MPLTLPFVATRDDLNHEAVAALWQATRVLQKEGNKRNLARALQAEAADGPGETTVGAWLRDETHVPAWALIAAAKRTGTTMDKLVKDGLSVERLSQPTREGLTEQIRGIKRRERGGSRPAEETA